MRVIKENPNILHYYNSLRMNGHDSISAVDCVSNTVTNEYYRDTMLGVLYSTPLSREFVGKEVDIKVMNSKGLLTNKTTRFICKGIRHNDGFFVFGDHYQICSPVRIAKVDGKDFSADAFHKYMIVAAKHYDLTCDYVLTEKNFNIEYLNKKYPSFFRVVNFCIL